MSNMFGPPPGVGGLPPQSTTPAPQQQAQADDPTRVVVGPCVISYPYLFTPRLPQNPKPGDEPKYSAEFIVYQEMPEFNAIYQKLMTAANAASMEFFKKPITAIEKQGIRNLSVRMPDRQGIFFSANSMKKPNLLVGNPAVPVTDPDTLYPGAIVYVNVKAAAYDVDGGKGVKFYLNSILKAADGPRLAPERDASQDFAGVMQFIPPTPATQQFAPPQADYQAPPAAPQYPPQPGYPPAPQFGQPPAYPPHPQQPAYPPMPGYGFPQG